ncbi:unnamed protein product, partial [Urochloa humidicola]
AVGVPCRRILPSPLVYPPFDPASGARAPSRLHTYSVVAPPLLRPDRRVTRPRRCRSPPPLLAAAHGRSGRAGPTD